MPLRKNGTIIVSSLALTAGFATMPSQAGAFSLSDFLRGTTQSTTSTVTDTADAATDALAEVAGGTTDGCVQGDVRQAFEEWGDTGDYSLAPGGDFESASGWTLRGGARISNGNEDLGVQGGSKSLTLPLGATATSPAFCVDETNPYFRFVSKPVGSVAGYTAAVIYRNAEGQAKSAQFTASTSQSWAAGKWNPSAISPLATKIPLLGEGATASVQIVFTSTGNSTAVGVGLWGRLAFGSNLGTVSIDSLMVDPYRRG